MNEGGIEKKREIFFLARNFETNESWKVLYTQNIERKKMTNITMKILFNDDEEEMKLFFQKKNVAIINRIINDQQQQQQQKRVWVEW